MNIGVINETLRLTDGFSASFRAFIQMGSRSTNVANSVNSASQRMGASQTYAAKQLESMKAALTAQQSLYAAQGQQLQNQITKVSQLTAKYEKLVAEKGAEARVTLQAASALARAQIQESNLEMRAYKTAEAIAQQNKNIETMQNKMRQVENETNRAAQAQKKHGDEIKKSTASANSLVSVLGRIATVTGATALVKSFLETSDTMSQIDAKLNNMVASESELVSLQNQIYQSAQRSRAAYTDTANLIARLGSNAKDTFNSNAELIQFAENLNKSFAIAGASQQEQSAATLQLTQALASGVLRGDELNSVFEQAPNIIQRIADYLNVSVGEIREMASEGQLTSEVVKNAMLSATNEINAEFEAMPMTLAQAFTMGKNAIQNALRGSFEGWSDFLNSDEGQQAMTRIINLFTLMAQVGVGALSAIGQGALFVANNLDFILPVLAAIGAAYALMHAKAIAAAAAQVGGALASAAAWAVANWPVLLLIAVLAGALIAAQQFGIGMEEVGGVVGQVLGTLYAVAYNVFAGIWNVIAAFAEFFANVWNDPLGATARLFFDVFDVILGIVETVAGAIDTLLGTDMAGAVSGFRSKMSGWVDDTFGENAVQIKRMANLNVSETAAKWGQTGSNIGSKLDNMNLSLDSIAGGIDGLSSAAIPTADELNIGDVDTVGRVKSVDDDVTLADEDLKLYRDLAERRYMTNVELQTLAPQISITVPDGSAKNFDIKELEAMLKALLIQQAAAHTAISHS